MGLHEYQVIGRSRPTKIHKKPQVYRMRIFAPTAVHAKSRFWYFLGKIHKIKSASGEILSLNQIFEGHPTRVKNFAILVRYNSRSGTHNMHKEYRDLTRIGAVEQLYSEMASRHRARFRSIQIVDVKEAAAKECRRPNITQFHNYSIKFPLPHRRPRCSARSHRSLYAPHRPRTHF